MLVRIIQYRPLWYEAQRDSKAAAKGLYEPAVLMRLPKRSEVWHLPSLAASPL